jgi:hypothetical protein
LLQFQGMIAEYERAQILEAAYRHGTIERLVLIAPTWRGPLTDDDGRSTPRGSPAFALPSITGASVRCFAG